MRVESRRREDVEFELSGKKDRCSYLLSCLFSPVARAGAEIRNAESKNQNPILG
jgi:hypothetical protein